MPAEDDIGIPEGLDLLDIREEAGLFRSAGSCSSDGGARGVDSASAGAIEHYTKGKQTVGESNAFKKLEPKCQIARTTLGSDVPCLVRQGCPASFVVAWLQAVIKWWKEGMNFARAA